jgi:hypothetical protein
MVATLEDEGGLEECGTPGQAVLNIGGSRETVHGSTSV